MSAAAALEPTRPVPPTKTIFLPAPAASLSLSSAEAARVTTVEVRRLAVFAAREDFDPWKVLMVVLEKEEEEEEEEEEDASCRGRRLRVTRSAPDPCIVTDDAEDAISPCYYSLSTRIEPSDVVVVGAL